MRQFITGAAALLIVLNVMVPTVSAQEPHKDVAPPPLGQLVDIGGRKLHLHCSGKGTPTVIIENGSSGFSIDWALVQADVSQSVRVCSYDRAGFAWSDDGPAINTVEQTMDDLHLLLHTASIPPPYVLVGASIGGMYVRAYQRRYPNEVVGMVFVDATPEEDLQYRVNGRDKPGLAMTYDEMKAVYEPYIKNPPAPQSLPTEVGEPYDRLPHDLQGARLWAQRKWFANIDMPHSWITAASWGQEFSALRKLRLAHPYVLGDLPLIVLSRGLRTDAVLREREAELATLSRRAQQRIAEKSDHEIHLYQPELVAKSIRDVIAMAKHKTPASLSR